MKVFKFSVLHFIKKKTVYITLIILLFSYVLTIFSVPTLFRNGSIFEGRQDSILLFGFVLSIFIVSVISFMFIIYNFIKMKEYKVINLEQRMGLTKKGFFAKEF